MKRLVVLLAIIFLPAVHLAAQTNGSYTRTITTGHEWGTICLRNGVDYDGIEGATVYTLTGKTLDWSQVELTALEPTDKMEAGHAYIFHASGTEVKFTYNNDAEVAAPVEGEALVGTFEDTTVGEDGMYVMSGDRIYPASAYSTVKANRAYIDFTYLPDIF